MASAIDVVGQVGGFFALCGDTFRGMFRRPFQLQEFLEQTRFIAGVSIFPVIFVTIPFTVVVQFFIGQLEPVAFWCGNRRVRSAR